MNDVSAFEEEFRAFALAESLQPPPLKPVLFYGSSSVRLWTTLAQDFPDVRLVNHGFGGSTLAECIKAMERLVYPINPRAVFLYAGDNDLDHGSLPESVNTRFWEFILRLDSRLGPIPVITMTIKPSPARYWNLARILATNELLRHTATLIPHIHLLDTAPLMLRPDGTPRFELYADDGLHLNRAGYALWASQLRPCLAQLGLCDEPRISQMV